MTKVEKHDYKFNIGAGQDTKYGVDPVDPMGQQAPGNNEHLVLPAAHPKSDPYNPESVSGGEDKYDKYQAPDMSHLHSSTVDLRSPYALPEGLLSLRPPPDSQVCQVQESVVSFLISSCAEKSMKTVQVEKVICGQFFGHLI